MTLSMVLALLGGCAGLLAFARLLRGVWRANRRVVRTLDMVPRMAALVEELSPDSGRSVKDQVTQTAATAARTETKVDELTRRFDDHVQNHPGAS